MKALNLHEIGDLRYEDAPDPELERDEALVKVLAAGICGSDIPRVFSKGTYLFPTIPGHEFAGVVTAVGKSVSKSLISKRVTVFPLIPCFKCSACKNEDYATCSDYDYYGSRRDGAFAEFVAVKAWNLALVPEKVPTVWAAMTEPCSVAIHAIERIDIKKGETVCIYGAGAIGLIMAQLAKGLGAEDIILLDMDEHKLEFALSTGFENVLNTMDEDHLDELMRLTGGKGADICIDAAGVTAAVVGCFDAVAAFGRVLLLGNPPGDMLFKQADYWKILRKQLTLIGTWNSDFGRRKNDWKKALYYMESGAIDLSGFVTHVFPLAEADAAFDLVRDSEEFCVKVMFVPSEEEIEKIRQEGNI